MSIHKCPKCNSEIGSWNFCFYCGANLKEQISSERQEPDSDEAAIDESVAEEALPIDVQNGTSNSSKKCPKCGSEIGDWDFCFHCGANLKERDSLDCQEPDYDVAAIDESAKEESVTEEALPIDIQNETSDSSKKCPKCGSEIGDWDFCFHCGASHKEQASLDHQEPDTDVAAIDKSVAKEALPIDIQNETSDSSKKCPKCGSGIGDWDFCFHCGANLKEQVSLDRQEPDSDVAAIDESAIEESVTEEALPIDIQNETSDSQKKCPKCGSKIGDWDFCFHCGANLKEQVSLDRQEPDSDEAATDESIIEEFVQSEGEGFDESYNENNLQDDAPNDRIIVLTDEEGNEAEFEFLDLITYCEKEYVVLLPNDENADEVVILEFEELSDGTEHYSSVENDFTLQVVFQIFKQRAKDEFNFID